MEIKSKSIFLYVGILSLVYSLAMLYVLITGYQIEEKNEIWAVVGMFVASFLGCLYLLCHYFNYRILIDEKIMEIKNELGKRKKIQWNEIEKVDYNKTLNMFILFKKGRKTKISALYPHFLDFIDESKYSEKLKGFINLNKRPTT